VRDGARRAAAFGSKVSAGFKQFFLSVAVLTGGRAAQENAARKLAYGTQALRFGPCTLLPPTERSAHVTPTATLPSEAWVVAPIQAS
jgi:hypothetical protein